jgi:hypothetical protein
MNDIRYKNMKKVFDIAKQEMFFYKSDIAIEEINEIMRENDNYDVFIGAFHHDGFMSDYSLNDNSDKALMDFDGGYLVDYLVNYYDKLDQNLTVAIFITYKDSDGDYVEYSIEYNGYELFSDER